MYRNEVSRLLKTVRTREGDFWIKRNFNFLASVCSCEGRFESQFVKSPEDRFFRVEAPLKERERVTERDYATKKNCNNKTVLLSANNKLNMMEYKNQL